MRLLRGTKRKIKRERLRSEETLQKKHHKRQINK
jgi:hypothetical protein